MFVIKKTGPCTSRKIMDKAIFPKKHPYRIDNLSVEPILFEWSGILITLLLKKSATSNA